MKNADRVASVQVRRRLLGAGLALPLLAWRGVGAQALRPTPACGEAGAAVLQTPAQTAGPYYTPNSPKRASLIEPGGPGRRLILAGRVVTTACRPVSGALLDVWHCDAAGRYDNQGYRFRGHLFADGSGRYRLETIVPGLYPGRARHIHIRVQAPGGQPLTTQLYFPRDGSNAGDGLWRPELEIANTPRSDRQDGRFDFVLEV